MRRGLQLDVTGVQLGHFDRLPDYPIDPIALFIDDDEQLSSLPLVECQIFKKTRGCRLDRSERSLEIVRDGVEQNRL